MGEPLVTVAIVTWNSMHYLPNCIAAISEQSYPSLELIVIDNASIDRSPEFIEQIKPRTQIIRNPINTGFCHAHNQGIKESKGSYYLALNPDVALQPKYIQQLVNALEKRPEFGVAGGKLLSRDEITASRKIDSTGLFINRQRRQYLRGHGQDDKGQFDQPGEVFGIDGAAPLYKRAMLEEIKIQGEYFDEIFFAHKEDVDLAWRSRLFGWRAWYTPEAIAYHDRSFKPGKRGPISQDIKLHAVKNRYLMLLKNETKAGWYRDGLQILLYDLKILIYLVLFERSSLSALKLIKKDRKRIISWRKEIASRTQANSSQILSWFR